MPTDLPPTAGPNPWDGTYYSICPSSLQETGKALVLQHVVLKSDGPAAWLEDAVASGSYDLKTPSTSVIACQGHAFSKPQEFLAITPNSDADPTEPGEKKRVHRGGSYLCTEQYCTRYIVGTRGKGETSTGTDHLGFRCVRDSS